MAFEDDLAQQQQKDLPLAKDQEKYGDMVRAFSNAEEKDDLKLLAMLYILDLRFERADICLAIHTVEKARGWHR